jgi:hypothetical protein
MLLHYIDSWLILFKEIIAVYSENHKKPINIVGEVNLVLILKQVVQ